MQGSYFAFDQGNRSYFKKGEIASRHGVLTFGENLVEYSLCSGRGAAWLAHLHGVQGVGGSNPLVPTI